MDKIENKGNALALLPIGVFLIVFLGSGIITGDFYAMPAIVAFLIALCVAPSLQVRIAFGYTCSIVVWMAATLFRL